MMSVKGKNVLVTGGSGFLGEALVERLILMGAGKIRIISRNEGKLISLKQRFPSIEIFPGDITSQFDIHQAAIGMHCCFHLAAFKHVGMAEKFSLECTRSNVVGTINVLEESTRNCFDFVVGISTDKAAQVSGVYGASKLLTEKLFSQYESINEKTKYRVVRYGNVLYSTGSVLCKWKELLQKGEHVIVTDPEATRFFWSREQAVDLIFQCMSDAKDSTPWVPEMKSMKVGDLLTAMAKKYLPEGASLSIKKIGLQPGENLHEKILESGPYSNEVPSFTVEEIMRVI
jgi:nucleoside-diphosphate-sugar epimerase